jgi:hypothetical protein
VPWSACAPISREKNPLSLRIHAKAYPAATPRRRDQLGPQLSQKRQARFAIVHVAGPILHAEDVGGFGDVRQDRVVTRHLPVMRVEAAEGAFHLQPGRDHHAVHIDRDRPQPERRQPPRDHAGVQILQSTDGRHRERFQPATDRAGRWQALEPREAAEHGIVGDIGDMPQATPADHEQADQQSHHRHDAVVTPSGVPAKHLAHQGIEACPSEIAAEQLEACVRRQCDVAELQRQITIDTRRQIEFPLSHGQRPFVVDVEGWVAPPFNHNGGPFSISKQCAA